MLSRDIDPGQEAAGNIFGLQFVNKRCSVWALCGMGCQKVAPQDKTMPTAHREQAGLYVLGPAGAGHTGSWRQKLRRAPWLVCLLLDVLCEGGHPPRGAAAQGRPLPVEGWGQWGRPAPVLGRALGHPSVPPAERPMEG